MCVQLKLLLLVPGGVSLGSGCVEAELCTGGRHWV